MYQFSKMAKEKLDNRFYNFQKKKKIEGLIIMAVRVNDVNLAALTSFL